MTVLFSYFLIFLFSCFVCIFLANTDAYAGQKNTATPILTKISKPVGLHLPIDCKIGENCHVMNYVDFTPDDGTQTDPACLSRTYDSHKGTDFALLDGKAMEQGVDVLSPLAGTITKIRDGEPDQWSTKQQLEEIQKARKECGNAVMINHGNGIQTIYCHLKKNSITVQPNQSVKAGDKIAEVGLSGFTEFPHLHFGLLKNKKNIDPFTGKNTAQPCGTNNRSLWKKELDLLYQPFDIQVASFSDEIPNLKKIDQDNNIKQIIATDAPVFTFWTILLGVREGDVLTLEIKDPNGKRFSYDKIIQNKNRIKQFYYIGKNMKNQSLKEGAYTGHVEISRKNKDGKDTSKDKFFNVLVTK